VYVSQCMSAYEHIYICVCQKTNDNSMITSKCLLDTVESRNSMQSFCLLLEEGSSCCVFLPPTHPKWVTYKMHVQLYKKYQCLHVILCMLLVAIRTRVMNIAKLNEGMKVPSIQRLNSSSKK
jgi:hypothetical protein